MRIGLSEVEKLISDDKTRFRKRVFTLLAAAVIILIGSLCLRTVKVGIISPANLIESYGLWFKLNIGGIFDSTINLYRHQLIAEVPDYYDALSRFKITLLTFGCGVLLAMAGHIFQTVFRNPIAAPTMLGVNAGVELGVLALVIHFGSKALYMPFEKYIYCYTGAVIMLAVILIFGKLSSGKNKFSVFDLLIVGAILSQVASAVKTYYTFNMDNDYVLLIQEIVNAVRVDTEKASMLLIGIVLPVSAVAMYLVRFSFNAVAFERDESRSYGINTTVMKVAMLILGTFMVTAALVQCGTIGMTALIVPFISRSIFGADSRKLFWSNALIGGSLLVLCRDIAGMIKFTSYGLPVGTIVEFIAVPIFVLILIGQRRTWE